MSALLTIIIVHTLGMVSPGPDFALVMQSSLVYSRRTLLWIAIGLGGGVALHVTYCLLGIGLIISQSILLYNGIKIAGGLYLVYLGCKALLSRAPKQEPSVTGEKSRVIKTLSPARGLLTGFLCNALNPKATVFFLAVFTQVIDPATPLGTQVFYGAYMSVATAVYFASLGYCISASPVQKLLHSAHQTIEKIMGAVLIALGLRVMFSSHK